MNPTCPRCKRTVTEVRRVVGVFDKPGARYLLQFPVGNLLCPSCFKEQGLPARVRLVPEEA